MFYDEITRQDTELSELITEYNKSTDLKKVSLIIEMLKSKNQKIRLFCSKHITEMGNMLGIDRIEEELIPYVTDLILNFEDDEEVLTEFANQLVSLLLILQKNKKFSTIAIRSLEILSGNDDEGVRKKATESLTKLIQVLNEEMVTNEVFPLMRRLIENDSKTKMSCCYLFPVVYPKLKDEGIKKELIKVYHEISQDDSPSVRRAAADNIKEFCQIKDKDVIGELFLLYGDFIKDSVDIVKIYAIESTKFFLEKLTDEQRKETIQKFTESVSKDKSWRVKYSATESICEICKQFPKEFNTEKFSPVLLQFLLDVEPEVKCSVLSNFDKYIQYISLKDFKDNFLALFQQLAADTNLHVREVHATCIIKCVKYLKEDEGLMKESIIPLLMKLLKDEYTEVQYAAIQNINELLLVGLQKGNEDLLEKSVIPIIDEGMVNQKWRVRLFVAENLLKTIKEIPIDIINKYFLKIIIQLFTDHAKEIRDTCLKIIKEIVVSVDKGFLREQVWDLQKEKFKSKNYILRISSLNSVNFLKEYYEKDFLKNTIGGEIMNVFKDDKVPNAKFVSCQIMKDLALFINQRDFYKKVGEYINSFKNDKDVDVRDFSSKAYKEIANKI